MRCRPLRRSGADRIRLDSEPRPISGWRGHSARPMAGSPVLATAAPQAAEKMSARCSASTVSLGSGLRPASARMPDKSRPRCAKPSFIALNALSWDMGTTTTGDSDSLREGSTAGVGGSLPKIERPFYLMIEMVASGVSHRHRNEPALCPIEVPFRPQCGAFPPNLVKGNYALRVETRRRHAHRASGRARTPFAVPLRGARARGPDTPAGNGLVQLAASAATRWPRAANDRAKKRQRKGLIDRPCGCCRGRSPPDTSPRSA